MQLTVALVLLYREVEATDVISFTFSVLFSGWHRISRRVWRRAGSSATKQIPNDKIRTNFAENDALQGQTRASECELR